MLPKNLLGHHKSTPKNFRISLSISKKNKRLVGGIIWILIATGFQFSSVTQSCLTLCDPMNRSIQASCPLPSPGVHSNSRPSSRWCHPAISSSVVPFSSCPQSLPASESFPRSQLFPWGGQNTGVSALASFLPKNGLAGSPCSPRDSQESSPTPQFKRINSSTLSFLHSLTLASINDPWKLC